MSKQMDELDLAKTKKGNKVLERVTIADDLKEKLTSLCSQANEALQGIATVTKSDITNLILRSHSETLNKSEIEVLKTEHLMNFDLQTGLLQKLE